MAQNQEKPIDVLNRCAERVIALVQKDEPERKGGYFSAFESDESVLNGYCVSGVCVGTSPAAKNLRYQTLSAEKAFRLAARPDDLSSWQSRDPNDDKWGGAVRGDTSIFSFSGLPELADEAISLYVAIEFEELTPEKAMEIAKISSNEYYFRLAESEPKLQPAVTV